MQCSMNETNIRSCNDSLMDSFMWVDSVVGSMICIHHILNQCFTYGTDSSATKASAVRRRCTFSVSQNRTSTGPLKAGYPSEFLTGA